MVDPNRTDLQSVVAHKIDGRAALPFTRGLPADSSIITNAQLFVSHKPSADLVGTALPFRIMSDRLLATIRSFVPDEDLQVLPAPLIDNLTKEPVAGYSVVNLLRTIEALAPGCSPTRLLVEPLVLNEDAVPPSVHYFRLAEAPSLGVISEDLQNALFQQDFQGVLALPMKTLCAES
jgi:hypothetical protein